MKLQNDLNIYFNKIDNIGFVDFKLCFKAGLVYEPSDKYGITHLLEHMLFRGMGKYDYCTLEKHFKDMGAEVYGKSGYDCLSLSFSVLSSKVDEVIQYFNELFSFPCWTYDDLNKEKSIVKHEISLKGNKFSKRIKRLYDNAFLNKSVLGCFSSIDRITLNDLFEYYSRVVQPDNAYVFVSGDLSENHYKKLIDSLSNINRNSAGFPVSSKKIVPDSAFNRKDCVCLEYDDLDYSDLYINFDVPKEYQNAARLIQYYLSGYTSPLSEVLIDEKSLSYELYSQLDEWKDFSIIIFFISCKYDALCNTIEEFAAQLNKIIHEFDEVKYTELINFISLEKAKEKVSPIKTNDMMFYKKFYGIDDNIPTYEQVIDAMKSIFVKENFSIYSTYSVKKKKVIDSISNFKNYLNKIGI